MPDRFVAVPDDGVPSAPLSTTGAPALPTLIARAVPTPVPSPVMPPTATALAVPAVSDAAVPVALVSVIEDGVPPAPLNSTGAPALPILTASAVATPVPSASHAIVVEVLLAMKHGAVEPMIVVVPGVMLPLLGVAQLAAVELEAVSTCPFVGAVAAFTTTVVVALFSPLAVVAVPAVRLAAVPLMLVPTSVSGVPSALLAPVSVTTPASAHGDALVKMPVAPPVSVAEPEPEPNNWTEPIAAPDEPRTRAPRLTVASASAWHADPELSTARIWYCEPVTEQPDPPLPPPPPKGIGCAYATAVHQHSSAASAARNLTIARLPSAMCCR